MVVKKILIWSISLIVYMGILNPYVWYCSELTSMGSVMQILMSKCFVIMIFSSLISIFLLNYINVRRYIIFLVLIFILIIKIVLVTVNVGMPFESIKIFITLITQHTMGYLGNLIGLVIGYLVLFYKSSRKI